MVSGLLNLSQEIKERLSAIKPIRIKKVFLNKEKNLT